MDISKRGTVQFLAPPMPGGDQLSVQGFTTRHGGLSRAPYNSFNLGFNTQDQHCNVEGNRSLLARAAGSRLGRLLTVTQVHGSDLLVLDTPNPDFSHFQRLECDGIVTNQPQVLIGVCVADCYPILLLDPEKRAVAALHAGWKGTAAGICRKGVSAMVEFFGSRPSALHAAIGPGIGPCCYEVDEPVRGAFMAQGNGWEPFAQPGADTGRWPRQTVSNSCRRAFPLPRSARRPSASPVCPTFSSPTAGTTGKRVARWDSSCCAEGFRTLRGSTENGLTLPYHRAIYSDHP
jgi:polyphenol oxidase